MTKSEKYTEYVQVVHAVVSSKAPESSTSHVLPTPVWLNMPIQAGDGAKVPEDNTDSDSSMGNGNNNKEN